MSVGLSYNTFNTGNTAATSAASGSGGNGSVWGSIFGNLGGILQGAGSFVRDVKTDYNQIARDQAAAAKSGAWNSFWSGTGLPANDTQQRSGSSPIVWIVLAVLALGAIIFFATRK